MTIYIIIKLNIYKYIWMLLVIKCWYLYFIIHFKRILKICLISPYKYFTINKITSNIYIFKKEHFYYPWKIIKIFSKFVIVNLKILIKLITKYRNIKYVHIIKIKIKKKI